MQMMQMVLIVALIFLVWQIALGATLFLWVAEAFCGFRHNHAAAAKAARYMRRTSYVVGCIAGATALFLGITCAPEIFTLDAIAPDEPNMRTFFLQVAAVALASGVAFPMFARWRERKHLALQEEAAR